MNPFDKSFWDERYAADGYVYELSEGPGHSGMSALIDFIARRPSA